MSRSLLLFTIGPVQPFIAQARKTRDLWLGSYLLSRLMEAAMRGLEENLVFPGNHTVDKTTPDLPNKFVALFLGDVDHAQKEAKQATDRLHEAWDDIAGRVWRHVLKPDRARDLEAAEDTWKRQITFDTLFEVYWVVTAREPDEKYGDWYRRSQDALDARKRLRDFQFQDEPGEKSTISGERQALYPPTAKERKEIREFWKKIAGAFPEAQISHDGTEHLDAIDLIKRFAARACYDFAERLFPSTSTVAAAPFIVGMFEALQGDNPQLHEALKRWETLTAEPLDKAQTEALPYLANHPQANKAILRRDGDCWFAETFTAKRLQQEYNLSEEEAKQRALSAPGLLRGLFKEAAEKHVRAPMPYYAVLTMDGDHMGKLLSGISGESEHRSISKALSSFSRREAPRIVETDYPARLVYAGGDDVLALAPVEHALSLSQQFQAKYVETMDSSTKALRERAKQDGKPLQVTMSAGMAVAYHLSPLSVALREARRAEELAKEAYGRNALVATLLRRSGEATTVGCKWSYPTIEQETDQPLQLFKEVADFLRADVISTRFVYNLAEEAPTLSLLPYGAQESEVRRLLIRGWSSLHAKRARLPDATPHLLAGRLVRLARAMSLDPRKAGQAAEIQEEERQQYEYAEIELWRDGPRRGLVEISGWLLFLVFSLRGGTD